MRRRLPLVRCDFCDLTSAEAPILVTKDIAICPDCLTQRKEQRSAS